MNNPNDSTRKETAKPVGALPSDAAGGWAALIKLRKIINRSRPRVFSDRSYTWTVKLPLTCEEYDAFNDILKPAKRKRHNKKGQR